jgi:hypothetical protein
MDNRGIDVREFLFYNIISSKVHGCPNEFGRCGFSFVVAIF